MRLVRSVLVVAATALILAALLLARPEVATADVLAQRDAVGDVSRSPVGSSLYVPVPTQVQGDIVATRTVHARRAFWIQIRLRELTTSTQGNFHLVAIKSRWRLRNIRIDAFPGHWEGRAVTTDAHGSVVACAVTHRIDYDRNQVLLRVPRSCLGTPRWVRAGIRSTVAGALFAYADDARSPGAVGDLAFGRRIRL